MSKILSKPKLSIEELQEKHLKRFEMRKKKSRNSKTIMLRGSFPAYEYGRQYVI